MEPVLFGGAAIVLLTLVVWVVARSRRREEAAEAPGAGGAPEPATAVAPKDDVRDAAPAGEPRFEAAVETPPPPPSQPPSAAPRDTEERKRRIGALRKGLGATRGGLVLRLSRLFKGRTEIAPDLVQSIEEVLITSDVGAKTAARLIDRLRDGLAGVDAADQSRVWEFLREEARAILSVPAVVPEMRSGTPYVIIVVGVNGTGKTTTIGKLAARYRDQGSKVILAAADTFRAAAVSQLQVWGRRVGCEVVCGKEGADPSSVAFDAIEKARAAGIDVVIVDTAGRLHTKQPLMEELGKIARATGKAQEGAPHEVLLTLDATTGQNAMQQAATFLEATKVTGIALTKLDGTAKGGVILGVCDSLGLPVRYIGVGEGIEDLRPFDPDIFVAALFDDLDDVDAAA